MPRFFEPRCPEKLTTSRAVSVNNAPPGAAKLTPADGSLVHGQQPVIAALAAGGTGVVSSLQVDNQPIYSAEPVSVFVRLAITVRRVLRPTG